MGALRNFLGLVVEWISQAIFLLVGPSPLAKGSDHSDGEFEIRAKRTIGKIVSIVACVIFFGFSWLIGRIVHPWIFTYGDSVQAYIPFIIGVSFVVFVMLLSVIHYRITNKKWPQREPPDLKVPGLIDFVILTIVVAGLFLGLHS